MRNCSGIPFIADYYARSSKRGGAWMNAYVSQSRLTGECPVVANHLNVPKPPEGEPTLLTFDEVTTMFHEFGHALHQLTPDQIPDADGLLAFEAAALRSAGVALDVVRPRYRSTYFSHIMGGYDAGYYISRRS